MGTYPIEKQIMKQVEYFRKGKTIRSVASGGGSDEIFSSINAAKKASRKLQQKNGGLGCGVLSVVEKFPATESATAA